MRRATWTLALLGGVLGVCIPGCGGGSSEQPDAPPLTPDADPLATLAGTGLCIDPSCAQISADVRAYEPRFQLYDDGATKRRWIYLPPGTQIDTADMNFWMFPVGTKVWKEFSRDNVRVETRLITKRLADDNAPGAWFYTAYQWNAAQDAAVAVTDGVKNANGTEHDIPSRDNCRDCHERVQPSRVLGFGAIQLDAPSAQLDLDDLVAMNALTKPPGGTTPRFPLPTTPAVRNAFGYFHANCGHCHNPSSDVFNGMTKVDLRLRTDIDMVGSPELTPAHASTVNKTAEIPYTEGGTQLTRLVVPDDVQNSALFRRMNSTNPIRFMPNLAVEKIDGEGQTIVTAWINALP